MIAEVDLTQVITIVAVLVGSSGVFGGIYALLRLRPEAGQITVTASQGALIVQTGVIETLRQENERLHSRVNSLERENEDLRLDIRGVKSDVADLKNGGST